MFTIDKTKGFLAGVVLTAIFSFSFSVFAATVEKQIKVVFSGVKVSVDGKQVTLKDANGKTLEPLGYDGSVYTPARGIAEALGATVTWDSAANTVKIVSGQSGNGKTRQDPAEMTERIKTILTSLVSKGTITQTQADKVLANYGTTGNSQGTGEKTDPLSKAVTDGIITQAQADAIKKEMMPASKPNN